MPWTDQWKQKARERYKECGKYRTHRLTNLFDAPEHKKTQASQGGIFFDRGLLRPWTTREVRHGWSEEHAPITSLLDYIKEGRDALHIAIETRRDPDDVLAMVRIAKWMIAEMNRGETEEMEKRRPPNPLDAESRKLKKFGFLRLIAQGKSVGEAAVTVGIHPSTPPYWRKHDAEFAEGYKDAKKAASTGGSLPAREEVKQQIKTSEVSQITKLANYIMANVPGEPSASEGAVDTAIRVMSELQSKLTESLEANAEAARCLEAVAEDRDTLTFEIENLKKKRGPAESITIKADQDGVVVESAYGRITIARPE